MRNSSGTFLGTQKWKPRKIGGLGFVTGGDIASDGSWELARTDVGGIYRRDAGELEWTQIITSDSMTIPPYASLQSPELGSDFGVEECAIAPSDVTVAYFPFRGRMMRSTNKGLNWVDDSLNGTTGLFMEANGPERKNRQHKLQVDPTNAAVAYYGSPNDGLWRRLNGVWAQIASVPASTEASYGNRTLVVAIDNSSALVGSGVTSRRSRVTVSVNGSGIYESTDGGTTFAILASYPNSAGNKRIADMRYGVDGTLWVADDSGNQQNYWKRLSGGSTFSAVTHTLPTWISSIEIDPKNSAIFLFMCSLSFPAVSNDTCATFIAYNQGYQSAIATTAPLAAAPYAASFLSGGNAIAGNFKPHPTENTSRLYSGYGVFKVNGPPWPTHTTGGFVWIEDTAGIEELVGGDIVVTTNGHTLTNSQDQCVILLDSSDGYATKQFPNGTLTHGAKNLDYALDNPNFCVVRICDNSQDHSAYCTDVNAWNWVEFPDLMGLGGTIAVSNSDQVVCIPGSNVWPRYFDFADGTWKKATVSGFATIADGTSNGWDYHGGYGRRIVTKDPSTPGAFYAWNMGPASDSTKAGIYKSTDGGRNWAKVGAGPDVGGLDPNFHVKLMCAVNGDLFFCLGATGSNYSEDIFYPLWRSIDGGVTWTRPNANLTEPQAMTWGAPAPGSSVPYALYVLGWLNHSYGFHRSLDRGVTWTTLPANPHFDYSGSIAGDPERFGRVVFAYTGTGYFETYYDYHLLVKGS